MSNIDMTLIRSQAASDAQAIRTCWETGCKDTAIQMLLISASPLYITAMVSHQLSDEDAREFIQHLGYLFT